MATPTWQELTYPISMEYRSHWGEWEAIREIVQNSLDETGTYDVTNIANGVAISDKGKGFSIKHLIFGVTEKSSADSRGRFGEGLKIALIVLKRLGCNVSILSENLEIVVDTTEIEGVKVLKLRYRISPKPITGTRIEINNYSGKLYDEYFATNKCVQKHVIFTAAGVGQIIDDDKHRLYVKDIYVQQLHGSEYSYNLRAIKLEESRTIAEEFTVQRELGRVWSAVSSVALMKKFLHAIDMGKYEAKAYASYGNSDVINAAFVQTYGTKCVLYTSETAEREAKWRGKRVIHVPSNLRDFFTRAGIMTDIEFLRRDNKKKIKKISKRGLQSVEKLTLRSMNVFVKMFDEFYDNRMPSLKVLPYEFPDDTTGQWNSRKVAVELSKKLLTQPTTALSTVLHELTHAYHCESDMTSGMVHKLGDVGAVGVMLSTCSESKWARAFRYFFRKAVLAAVEYKVTKTA